MLAEDKNRDRWRRSWDKESASYDKQMQLFLRFLAPDSRAWVCGQAAGDTLEVAIGTGLNLPHYAAEVRLTGVDFSPAMLELARRRAAQIGRPVDLRESDASALPFAADSFDTVVCTYGLCAIPDDGRAVSEMKRVLRPGGLLLLADHVAGAAWATRAIQRFFEVFTVPLQGEHFLRRPLYLVEAEGLDVEQRGRSKLGMIERLAARKPSAA
jgi:ubiquinone/menaquinone biosynthesis C-methylase UbiE